MSDTFDFDGDELTTQFFKHELMQHSNKKGLDINKVVAAALLYCDDTNNDKQTILFNMLSDNDAKKRISGTNENWPIFWDNLMLIAWDIIIALNDEQKYEQEDEKKI